jgi:HD-like signal output (HDOD) protein
MKLKSLIDQPDKLPTIPKVLQSLIESFNTDDVSVNEIAEQLAADPALTARLLRLANSAFFHVSRTIGTVDEAVRMLGFVMVRNLVLGNGMVAAFQDIPGVDLRQFWRYNLYTASGARWLANNAGDNGDTVFTVGMMHAVGQLQMHVGMPAEMLALDKQLNLLDGRRAALEKETLGFHYGDVSAGLARVWRFPRFLIDALEEVPEPLLHEPFCRASGWVHLGAWRARTELLPPDAIETAISYPKAVGKRLGIAPGWAVPASSQDSSNCTTAITAAVSASSAPYARAAIFAPLNKAMPPLKELTAGLEAMIE